MPWGQPFISLGRLEIKGFSIWPWITIIPQTGKVEVQELGWPDPSLQDLASLTMVLELIRPLTMGMENGIDQAILTV